MTVHEATGDSAYYPSYDANGNISEYLDNTGSVAVHYEYSPFGRLTLVDSETGALDFNHRFSTKFFDTETRLYYYGRRYYSSELGRWINRDPIEEYGGWNVNSFVINNPILQFDVLGLIEADATFSAGIETVGFIWSNWNKEMNGKGWVQNSGLSKLDIQAETKIWIKGETTKTDDKGRLIFEVRPDYDYKPAKNVDIFEDVDLAGLVKGWKDSGYIFAQKVETESTKEKCIQCWSALYKIRINDEKLRKKMNMKWVILALKLAGKINPITQGSGLKWYQKFYNKKLKQMSQRYYMDAELTICADGHRMVKIAGVPFPVGGKGVKANGGLMHSPNHIYRAR